MSIARVVPRSYPPEVQPMLDRSAGYDLGTTHYQRPLLCYLLDQDERSCNTHVTGVETST